MKELTLLEIQNISLDILIEFHNFCTHNELHYSLGYGTLIGAIRHHGYIPWDDDVDIMMPRPDFEKFCQIYKASEKYKLYAPALKNTFLTYARLCEMKKTVVISPAPWNKDKSGVWIDIFPIEGAPDDIEQQTTRFKKSRMFYMNQLEQRYIIKRWLGGLKGKISFIKEYLKGNGHINSFIKKYDEFCKEIPYGSTKHLTVLSCPNSNVNHFYNLEDFDDYILTDFQNFKFFIVTGYDHVLRCSYNNYMELPPIELRKPGHSGHKYFWK